MEFINEFNILDEIKAEEYRCLAESSLLTLSRCQSRRCIY